MAVKKIGRAKQENQKEEEKVFEKDKKEDALKRRKKELAQKD
jgi:hypothetical protein